MQNTIQKSRQCSIFFEKAGILSKNLIALTSSKVSYLLQLFFIGKSLLTWKYTTITGITLPQVKYFNENTFISLAW